MYKLSLFLSTGSSTDSDQVLFPLLCGQVVSDFQTLLERKSVNKLAMENKNHTILNILFDHDLKYLCSKESYSILLFWGFY